MVINYTSKWNNFQIRSCVNLFDNDVDPNEFDIVKWESHAPREVTNFRTGEKEISTESCFTIGYLIYSPEDEDFEFKSCGLRYFENRIDGLEEWLTAFCKMKEVEFRYKDDDGE